MRYVTGRMQRHKPEILSRTSRGLSLTKASQPGRRHPPPVTAHWNSLGSYLDHAQSVISVILSVLSERLGLPPSTLRDLQPTSALSGTMMRLIRNPPALVAADKRTGLLPHTDYGTITFLANVIGGLQILAPGYDPTDERGWKYVKPQPGCLIVNIGDAMVEWTGGVLRSNMHRVNYAPGAQAEVPRYSVAILVRPSKNVKMARLQGGMIPVPESNGSAKSQEQAAEMANLTAVEWERKKAAALFSGKDIARSRGGLQIPRLDAAA